MNIKLSVKFKIISLALVGMIGFSFHFFLTTHSGKINVDLIESLSVNELVAISTFNKLESDLQNYKSAMLDATDFEDWSIVEDADQLSDRIVDAYREVAIHIPSLTIATEDVVTEFNTYRRNVIHYVDISIQDNGDEVELAQSVRILARSINRLDKLHGQLRESVFKIFKMKLNAVSQQEKDTVTKGYILGTVLFILITIPTIVLSRSVANSIKIAVKVAGNIAKGNLEKEEYRIPNDDTGHLLNSLDIMRNNIEEYQRGILIISKFTEVLNSNSADFALSLAAIVFRESFNLPCVGLYVAWKDRLQCINVDTLDHAEINHELFDRLDIATNCFEQERPISLLISDMTENIQFNFVLGKADLFRIDAHPIIYGESCVGVVVLTHIKKPSQSDEDLINRCLERLAVKVNVYNLDKDKTDLVVHLRQRTQDLEILNKENLLISQAKSEFLACMSHEIRTPMNGVIGMLGLLKKGDLNSKQKHYAELAAQSADSLLRLINDILDFSKIEAGKLELDVSEFDLIFELGCIVESMAKTAQDKNLELILDLREVQHRFVVGDFSRIRQVIINLVGNAIKFTGTGEIVVRAATKVRADSKITLSCQVRDTGIGIPQDKGADLFNSFTQVDASTTREYGGTGLGLAIVKQLCELMSGSVFFNSEYRQGAEFEFSVELTKSDNQMGVLVAPNFDGHDLDILVVDDNATNNSVLSGQLKTWGINVSVSSDGSAALEVLNTNFEKKDGSISLVILDKEMPNVNGIELAKTIRNDSRYADVKLVLMTPMEEKEHPEYFAQLGFASTFHKPATVADLVSALETVTNSHKNEIENSGVEQVRSNAISSTPAVDANTRILLVEDNCVNQEVALGLLEDLGLNADIANNGVEAIRQLSSVSPSSKYDLILMDCQMPEMDGYDTTRNIRQGNGGEHHQEIPIIAMTANAMKGDKDKCLAAGMNSYLSKPIDSQLLIENLQTWLGGKSQLTNNLSRTAEKPDVLENEKKSETKSINTNTLSVEEVLKEAQITTNTAVNERYEEPLVWDQDALLKFVRKPERMVKLIHLFLNDMPQRMDKLRLAIENEDSKDAKALAHSIKGSAANLSAFQVRETAHTLEKAGNVADIQKLKLTWPEFEEQYQMLVSELNNALLEAAKVDDQQLRG